MKKMKRQRGFYNFDNAKSIGIIFNAIQKDSYTLAKDFILSLKKRNIEVLGLGYVNNPESINYPYIENIEFFSLKNHTWYLKPATPSVDHFAGRQLDILIDLSLEDKLILKYIVGLSNAKLKIGTANTKQNLFYDFMIDVQKSNTLPYYIDRAFHGTVVSANFEFFSNLNPLLIFFLAPMVAALTEKTNTYKMMILGTFTMALPTFLLAIGPNPALLLTYILLMSIGEAMWQPRFLQWVAEIAPEGQTGAYMGIAQFPWFLTKVITGLYSGWLLRYEVSI